MTGHELSRLFIEFNQRYFSGKLPRYRIRVVDRLTALGAAGPCNRERRVIRIERVLGESQTISTLLHEMVHAATTDGHGMPWKREMIRLREDGAPLAPADSEISLEDWSGLRVTKAHFESVLEELLSDVPEITLPQAIRHFIAWRGGPATVAEFKRKYPWSTALLRKTRKEHDQQVSRRAVILATIKSMPKGD